MVDTTRKLLSLSAAALAVFALWGCSPSNGSNSGGDASSTADALQEDVTEDTGQTDTGSSGDDTSLGDIDSGDQPPIARFKYWQKTTGCTKDCVSAIEVNLSRDKITRTENASTTEEMDPSDTKDLRENYITQKVLEKMKNGWECGSKKEIAGTLHQFRAWEPGFRPDKLTANIAGCIPDDSTQADAERVQKIVDKLQSLRSKYF